MTGLNAQFIEAPLQMQKRMSIPNNLKEMCKMLKVPTSGNAAGFHDTETFTSLTPSPDYLVL